jgi:hypothetical protein
VQDSQDLWVSMRIWPAFIHGSSSFPFSLLVVEASGTFMAQQTGQRSAWDGAGKKDLRRENGEKTPPNTMASPSDWPHFLPFFAWPSGGTMLVLILSPA